MKVWGDMIYSSNGHSYMDFKVEVVKHYAKARALSERYLPEVLSLKSSVIFIAMKLVPGPQGYLQFLTSQIQWRRK